MANHPKHPENMATQGLSFKVPPRVKRAIDEMIRRRDLKIGDPSAAGWFLALVFDEAERLGIKIDPPPPDPPTEMPSTKAKSKGCPTR